MTTEQTRDVAYDQIDRFLRNNLSDADYADYSQALDRVYAAPDHAAWAMCSQLSTALQQIGDYAHDHSTGPAVPDHLWEIRRMAYETEAAPTPTVGTKPR